MTTIDLSAYLDSIPAQISESQVLDLCNPVLAYLADQPPLTHDTVLRQLAKKTGAGLTSLRTQLKWMVSQAAQANKAAKQTKAQEGPEWTDLGNSMRLRDYLERDGELLVRYDESCQSYMVFTGAVWEAQGNSSLVRRRAAAMVDNLHKKAVEDGDEAAQRYWLECQSRRALDNMVELFKDRKGVIVPKNRRVWNQHPYLVNFTNGTLDLQTKELRKHRPSDMLTQCTGHRYILDALCPTWDRFLETSQPNSSIRHWLQVRSGSNLTGSARDQILVDHYGPGGAGKGTWFSAQEECLGDYCRKLHRSVFERQRGVDPHPTNLMDACDKRLVYGAEISPYLSVDQLKELTGGDIMKARSMGRDFVDLTPTWGVEIMSNKAPVIKEDLDDGIWSRLKVVPWTQQFRGRDNEDKDLKDKLAAEAEGILAWMVRGAYEWLERGLPTVGEIEVATQQIADENDHVQRFLDEMIVVEEGATVGSTALWELRQAWNEEHNERLHETQTAFVRALKKKGIGADRDGKGRSILLGIKVGARESATMSVEDYETETAKADENANYAGSCNTGAPVSPVEMVATAAPETDGVEEWPAVTLTVDCPSGLERYGSALAADGRWVFGRVADDAPLGTFVADLRVRVGEYGDYDLVEFAPT